ncbi:Uncharacterised protein [Bordetella pertussis]|nr:Uncharacterised protein [Bordetella pertussis]CFU95479.1 Uncharacterised protein [Bordetella pertussis]CPM85032.1 Uncharacterised protein [Bordetella pertussis]
MRTSARRTRSSMPSSGVVSERVPISPMTYGMEIANSFLRSSWLGMAIRLNEAGAGSVCHMASMAAIFIFWCSVVR